MTEIAELERRITAALDRIGTGIDGLAGTAAAADDADQLRDELAAERETNAQLEERVKALHRQQEGLVRGLEDQLEDMREASRATALEIRQMREANQKLQASIQSLREAQNDGIAEPHLVNQAMAAELEGLRATRDGDRAELDTILGRLKPLLGEQNNA